MSAESKPVCKSVHVCVQVLISSKTDKQATIILCNL